MAKTKTKRVLTCLLRKTTEALQESPCNKGLSWSLLRVHKKQNTKQQKKEGKKHDLLFWQWCIFSLYSYYLYFKFSKEK